MGRWPPIVVPRFLGVTSGSPCHAPRLVNIRSRHNAWYLVVTWHLKELIRLEGLTFDWKSIPLVFSIRDVMPRSVTIRSSGILRAVGVATF